MCALLLMLIFLATAATRASVGASAGAHDVASKQALLTAKAGLRVAIQRMNSTGLDLRRLVNSSTAEDCIVTVNGLLTHTTIAPGGAWCPTATEEVGSGASYSYQTGRLQVINSGGGSGFLGMILGGTQHYTFRRRIVVTGTADGVSRRIAADADAAVARSSGALSVLISGGRLGIYRVGAASFRECTATSPNASDPNTGC